MSELKRPMKFLKIIDNEIGVWVNHFEQLSDWLDRSIIRFFGLFEEFEYLWVVPYFVVFGCPVILIAVCVGGLTGGE